MLGKRVCRQAIDRRRVVALVKPLDQVLLQQRVRPVELIVTRGKQNLSPCQGN